MRGSGGADSNFGEIGILKAKISPMRADTFGLLPKLRRAKGPIYGKPPTTGGPPRGAAARNAERCRSQAPGVATFLIEAQQIA